MALCLSIASVTAEECIECTGGVCCPEGCAGEGNCLCDAGYLGCSTSDLTLNDIASDVCSWGSKDGVAAFSSSNSNCNPGDQKTIYWDWGVYGDKGSLVGQQAYRLKNDRFEQIGMSWLKYAWAGAHGTNTCSSRCCYTGSNDHLPAGCIDVYSATNNANQAAFGPRSHVNRVTGEALALIAACYNAQQQQGVDNVCGRLQVAHDDLDPDLNEGATYFVEHHWITSCEDLRDNNAAYREIVVDEDPDGCCEGSTNCTYVIEPAPSSATVTETPAIRAWKDADSSVVETDIHLVEDVSANESNCDEDPAIGETCEVEDESLLILAAKTTDLQTGWWQYEYALYNMNSHSAVKSFSVPLASGTSVCDIGFHDINYHSGEEEGIGEEDGIDNTDWAPSGTATSVRWDSADPPQGKSGNILRWGTLYNFRFRADAAPDSSQQNVTLGVNEPAPSQPSTKAALTKVPGTASSPCDGSSDDCNENGLPDRWDLCCGEASDCNSNDVPDECDLDCDTSGTPDNCEGCAAGCYCESGCYECCDDSHCTDPERPYCGVDNKAHTCVECTNDEHCPGKCYCGVLSQACICCPNPPCPMGPAGA